ncbi:MAG TPA: hypothetical protein PLQ87_14335, partial [Phycisphaerae bacterium]|nr:hypothetical protein [Phycisphaerae bacterium]
AGNELRAFPGQREGLGKRSRQVRVIDRPLFDRRRRDVGPHNGRTWNRKAGTPAGSVNRKHFLDMLAAFWTKDATRNRGGPQQAHFN